MPVAPQAVEKVVEKEIVVDVEEEGGAHAVVHAHMTYHEQTVVLPHDKCHHELVVSKLSSHSAKMVCESPSSWGPDFISMEDGYYCDMCEHTLWKLCLTRFDLNCWDMHKMELRMTRRTIAARSEAGSLRKKVHKRVEYWD
jgi:hypothetical protein